MSHYCIGHSFIDFGWWHYYFYGKETCWPKTIKKHLSVHLVVTLLMVNREATNKIVRKILSEFMGTFQSMTVYIKKLSKLGIVSEHFQKIYLILIIFLEIGKNVWIFLWFNKAKEKEMLVHYIRHFVAKDRWFLVFSSLNRNKQMEKHQFSS